MKTKKIWKDLQHGDVINCGAGTKGTVIDVLPHSAFIRFNTYDEVEEWYSFDDLKLRGWQIVQPEEEEKIDEIGYKEAFKMLDVAILNCRIEREAIREKYPHLFN